MLGIVWNQDTLAIVMLFGIPIVAILCGTWLKIAKTTSDNELKRTMVERGMSADEIERVMMASPGTTRDRPNAEGRN